MSPPRGQTAYLPPYLELFYIIRGGNIGILQRVRRVKEVTPAPSGGISGKFVYLS